MLRLATPGFWNTGKLHWQHICKPLFCDKNWTLMLEVLGIPFSGSSWGCSGFVRHRTTTKTVRWTGPHSFSRAPSSCFFTTVFFPRTNLGLAGHDVSLCSISASNCCRSRYSRITLHCSYKNCCSSPKYCVYCLLAQKTIVWHCQGLNSNVSPSIVEPLQMLEQLTQLYWRHKIWDW